MYELLMTLVNCCPEVGGDWEVFREAGTGGVW